MGALFGPDFKRRADLQRLQVHHQELLNSARFGPTEGIEGLATEHRDPNTGFKPAGPAGSLIGTLLALCFVITVPAAIVSAVLAMPVGWALMALARTLSGRSVDRYGGFYRSALSGIFVYLMVTILVAVIYAVLRAPHTDAGIVADFWAVLSPPVLGFQRGVSLLIPGLFACAGIWSMQIGHPFRGGKGSLWALTCATLCVPTSIAVFGYALIQWSG